MAEADMADVSEANLEGFELGRPALVCRWKLAGGSLPLEGRHLRALGARRIAGTPLSPELVAWAKQHLSWTLADGVAAAGEPDGVLMLVVDEDGRAAMSLGPYVPLTPDACDAQALCERARAGRAEAEACGVAPELLCAWAEDCLVLGLAEDEPRAAVASLVADLATTKGLPLRFDASLVERAPGANDASELALLSDEHGVVVATDRPGPHVAQLAAWYARLL
jgi:hypothetical protein